MVDVGYEWVQSGRWMDRCDRCDVGNFGPRLGEEREANEVGVGLLRHVPREPAPSHA